MLYKKDMGKKRPHICFTLRGPLKSKNGVTWYEDERYFHVNFSVLGYPSQLIIAGSNMNVLRKDSDILAKIGDCIINSNTMEQFEAAIQSIGFVEEK